MDFVNLNTAEPAELTTLPGVGPAMAERIINARPFETLEDVLTVRGFGPALLERLTPLVTLGKTRDVESVEDEPAIVESDSLPDDGFKPEFEEAQASEQDAALPEESSAESDPEEAAEPQLDAEITEDDEPAPPLEAAPEPEVAAIPKEKAIIPVKREKSEKKIAPIGPKPVTRMQVFLIAAASSFAAFILAVLLSIGILGGINNGLRYAAPSQVQKLDSQVNGIHDQIGILADDLDALRTRLDQIEGISGRVNDLEAQTAAFATQTEAINAEVEAITAQIDTTLATIETLQTEVDELTQNTTKFQNFLEGLGDLLASLTTPVEPGEEAPVEQP